MQRFLDIILSLVAIAVLSPLLVVIMIVLKLSGEHEIFYVQERIGLGGLPFGVLKFATMVKNSASIGDGLITTKGDPRVLPVGRILRKTKINEFPQLFNILKGDMSFVGPRPQVKPHFDVFPQCVKESIILVRPGLTGVGSIFFRDEESIIEKLKHLPNSVCYSDLIAPYKGALELWYIKNNSTTLYIYLIALTACYVLFPKSQLLFRMYKDLPPAPLELRD